VPFNPCDRTVDFIRRPYRTKFRPFKDRDDVWVDIQWYRAAANAPRMPFPTSFMSLDWTSSTFTRENPNFIDEPWLQRPGEVFNEPRPYSPWPTPLGLKYDHVCGTEDDFVMGATYDAGLDVKYDEQGLPLCCNGPAVPAFPMEVGFSATLDEGPDGNDCSTAIPVDYGDDVAGTVGPGLQKWYRLPSPNPDVGFCLHFSFSPFHEASTIGVLALGDDCSSTPGWFGFGSFDTSPISLGFPPGTYAHQWVVFTNDGSSGGSVSFTFKLERGFC